MDYDCSKNRYCRKPGHSDNVTFIAYAPYDDPEIAVAVVLEYGSRGTYSMNVAKDIFDAYFYGKTVDENGNLCDAGRNKQFQYSKRIKYSRKLQNSCVL